MGIDEERHGKKVGRSARAETPGDEALVNRFRPCPPVRPAHTAGIEEMPGGAARKAEAFEAAAV